MSASDSAPASAASAASAARAAALTVAARALSRAAADTRALARRLEDAAWAADAAAVAARAEVDAARARADTKPRASFRMRGGVTESEEAESESESEEEEEASAEETDDESEYDPEEEARGRARNGTHRARAHAHAAAAPAAAAVATPPAEETPAQRLARLDREGSRKLDMLTCRECGPNPRGDFTSAQIRTYPRECRTHQYEREAAERRALESSSSSDSDDSDAYDAANPPPGRLWCSYHGAFEAGDKFSSEQRKADAAARRCLDHPSNKMGRGAAVLTKAQAAAFLEAAGDGGASRYNRFTKKRGDHAVRRAACNDAIEKVMAAEAAAPAAAPAAPAPARRRKGAGGAAAPREDEDEAEEYERDDKANAKRTRRV